MTNQAYPKWLSGVLLISLVLVIGCTASPATPTTPALKPVTLQLQWVTQAQFAGYYVALDKGWYREEGIDLTIEPGGPDLIPVDLVAARTRDFGTALLADLIVAIRNGVPVQSIGQTQQTNGLLLVARKSSGISQPADFAGKRVGVWLGGWEAQFNALVAKEHIDPSSFQLVPQGFSMDPFLGDELDVASAMIYNEYHVLLESGLSADELNIIDYTDFGLGFPGDVLFTSSAVIEGDPDLCTRMVRASYRGWQYAIENPEEAADVVLKYDKTGTQSRDHQLSMMTEIARLVALPLRPVGFTDRDDVRRTIDTLASYGVLDGPVQPDQVYTNQFWEQARAESD